MAEYFGNITVDVVTDNKKVVVATVTLIADDPIAVTESAVCNNDDRFDEEVGIQLAVGRALRKLGRIQLRKGQNTIHANDRRAQREAELNAERAAQRAKRKEAFLHLGNPLNTILSPTPEDDHARSTS